MTKWGKRRSDKQSYPKTRRKSNMKKIGSTKSSGAPIKPRYIISEHETKDNREARKFMKEVIPNIGDAKRIRIKPTTFLLATNDDGDWVPFHGVSAVRRIKDRMEQNKPVDIPII